MATRRPAFQVFTRQSLHPTLLVGATGRYGSGKTETGLRMAFAVAKHFGGRVGVVDTESRRAELYQGKFGYFDHLPLNGDGVEDYALNGETLTAAMDQLVDQGCTAIVVDGISDEWALTCDRAGQDWRNWKVARPPHRDFLKALQGSKARLVVVTCRADEKYTVQAGGMGANGIKEKDKIVSLGEKHRQDKDLPYILDIFIRMDEINGQAVAQIGLKCRLEDLKNRTIPSPDRELWGPIVAYLAGEHHEKIIQPEDVESLLGRIRKLPKEGQARVKAWLEGAGMEKLAEVPVQLVLELTEVVQGEERQHKE